MKYIEIIKRNPLFKDIKDTEMEALLSCLSAKFINYDKNSFIIQNGDKISFVGILLSGKITVIKEDREGNRSIITEIIEGEMFGEAFACAGEGESMVSVQSASDCVIMLLDYKRIITNCSSSCEFHTILIENMLEILAKKILMLNQKIEILSKRTTREKLLEFFEMQSKKANSNKFKIPFDREQLANFLFVDRSSMSRELSRMRDEGLINFCKNQFELIR